MLRLRAHLRCREGKEDGPRNSYLHTPLHQNDRNLQKPVNERGEPFTRGWGAYSRCLGQLEMRPPAFIQSTGESRARTTECRCTRVLGVAH